MGERWETASGPLLIVVDLRGQMSVVLSFEGGVFDAPNDGRMATDEHR
jgi:hypothetical protein